MMISHFSFFEIWLFLIGCYVTHYCLFSSIIPYFSLGVHSKFDDNFFFLWFFILLIFLFSRVVRIAPFSNRLAQSVPSNIQALRCLSNFEALRFSEPIRFLAENMVHRMVKNSSASGGKYISIHLRFEEVFSLTIIYILVFYYYFPCIYFKRLNYLCPIIGYGSILMLHLWWWSKGEKRNG